MIIYELNNGEAAHKRKQFSHFSCKMVQAQLLKFFKKKRQQRYDFSLIRI